MNSHIKYLKENIEFIDNKNKINKFKDILNKNNSVGLLKEKLYYIEDILYINNERYVLFNINYYNKDQINKYIIENKLNKEIKDILKYEFCKICNRKFENIGKIYPRNHCYNCFKLKQCKYCNKYYIKTNNINTNKNNYCSRECQNNYYNIVQKYGVNALNKYRKENKEEVFNKAKELGNKWGNITGKNNLITYAKSEDNLKRIIKINKERYKNRKIINRKINKTYKNWLFANKILNLKRIEYYNSDIELIKLNNIIFNKEILNKPGIWIIKSNDIVLDICETNNIKKEIDIFYKRLEFVKDKDIKDLENIINYNKFKYKMISKFKNIKVEVFGYIENKEERLRIEAQIAWEMKALMWNKSIGQKLYIKRKDI